MRRSIWLPSLIVSLTSLLLIESAMADRSDRRQLRQRARIHEGVHSGELTRGEAARLRAGQRHVRRLERRAEADGEVTAGEKARLEAAQDRQSRRIYREKHDEQKADSASE